MRKFSHKKIISTTIDVVYVTGFLYVFGMTITLLVK
jgi:hypothetical protein